MDSERRYRFYAAEISYFSAKVRPALRYKQVPFEEIPPTPQAYREVIIPRTGLAFIPVLISPEDEVFQDTSDILDEIERRIPEPAIYPATPVQRVVAFLLEIYADEFGVLPAMHYRWSFPESEARARAGFAAFAGDEAASAHFADRMKGSLPLLGVLPETHAPIEAHTRELLDALSAHFQTGGFALGSRMSLADCALMGPLYAHLYLDAVPGRLLRETATRVCHWIERMNRPSPTAAGEWLADDALAPTLRPLLELVGRDAVPMILDCVEAFETWADERPFGQEETPRMVGVHRSQLRGAACQRGTSSYSLWMLQRPLDAYRALSNADRERVDQEIEGTGCEKLFAYEPRHRLAKRNFKLIFRG